MGGLRRGFVRGKAVWQKWEKGVIMQIQDFENFLGVIHLAVSKTRRKIGFAVEFFCKV